MNSRQIESWALRVIDCVKNGQPNEDFLVELKREFLDDHTKVARRIAGHANAARGENVLWLIGVDEKKSGADCVIGINQMELSNWYSQIESCFDELAPRMIPLNITIDEKIVMALLFETDRSPFVVKNPNGKNPDREVPWRENTAIRTAKRSDLIRLLSPLEKTPEIEIININLSASIGGEDSHTGNYIDDELRINCDLYVYPKSQERVIIPFHKCKVIFEISSTQIIESRWLNLRPAYSRGYTFNSGGIPGSITIESTIHELIINGAGQFCLEAASDRPNLSEQEKKCNIKILLYLHPVGAERPVILSHIHPYPGERLPS
jgi:hypothetical protein